MTGPHRQTSLKLGVLGAGAWGTALAIAFAREGHRVTLWARDAAQAEDMAKTRANIRYLPDAAFPDALAVTADLSAAAQGADVLLVVTPLAGLRPTLTALAADHAGRKASLPMVLWACKGIEVDTAQLPHQIVRDVLGNAACGALTGPSFAREVAFGLPTAITLAAADTAVATLWAQRLNSARLRLYATDDIVGAEVGGAVKNVLAIAAGVADGLALGHNARAALITRGLAEITRLAVRLGARPETLTGLAGLGDLVLTCTGDLWRNRRVGLLLAEGQALPDILAQLGHVAEGVPTTFVTESLATQLGVSMPITTAVAALRRGEVSARDALTLLMSREPGLEFRG